MIDMSNICRICLKEEYPKLPIFTEDEKSESKPTLPEKIMSFAQVKVVKDDGLPMYICVKCYCQVDTTVEFKRLCEESFNYLNRQLDTTSNLRASSPSLQDGKENFDGQHHFMPKDCIKIEDEPENEAEPDEPATQVLRVSSCSESWVKNNEEQIDTSFIKLEPSIDYSDVDFDLSNVEIENYTENLSNEEYVNPLDTNLNDFQNAKTPNVEDLMSTSNIGKSHKCRSCEIVFSSRQEMGFHISFAHRRCSTCSKYFRSNKDKDKHVCNQVAETHTDNVDQYRHTPDAGNKQIESDMDCQSKNTAEVAVINTERNMEENLGFVLSTQINPESEKTEDKIKCSVCDVMCLNEKALTIHVKVMHAGYRIIYPCFICKSKIFFNKTSCIKHLTQIHDVVASENIQFELKQVSSDTNTKGKELKTFKKGYYKSKRNSSRKTQCLKQTKDHHSDKKQPKRSKAKGKKEELGLRNRSKQSHPRFSHLPPVMKKNFKLIVDHKGVKRYVCRVCDVIYKSYVAAYKHYCTFTKRLITTKKEDEVVMDGKSFSCKLCKLKFATGNQAMMHRNHAHNYFYKKCGIKKK